VEAELAVRTVTGEVGNSMTQAPDAPTELTTDLRVARRNVDVDAEFAELFEQHRDPALRLAFVLCGDASAAEDAVAEAFARMYPRWRAGQVEDPGAYLRRAVVNQVRGGFRRLAVRRRHDAAMRLPEPVPPGDDRYAEQQRLRAALLALPPRQRAAVALRFLDDCSEAETAALLGVSTGAVKAYTSRGLERLRDLLDETHDGDPR
jgi:RNA polymerase sigma-70 factor (sigma-E family)